MQRNYVNAGGLFFFASQVSQGFMDDILSSNLSFQLGVSKEYDKFTKGEEWRQSYLTAMIQFGYGVTPKIHRQSFSLMENESVWELVRRTLGTCLSPALIEQGRLGLTRLHDSEGDALKLFRAYTTHTVAVQPEACVPQADESSPVQAVEEYHSTVALQLAFIDTETSITQIFLSFQTSSPPSLLPFVQLIDEASVTGDVEMMLLTSEFDDHSYARFREGFLTKLGQRRTELIMELKEGEK